MWVRLQIKMEYSTLTICLLALIVAVSGKSTVSLTETEPKVDYGTWRLSDFIMKNSSTLDANRRVVKEPPVFLSKLATTAANNASNKVANVKPLTMTKILSDLRAADDLGNDVIPRTSKVASALDSDVIPQPGKVATPSGKGVIPKPSKILLALSKEDQPNPSKTATTLGSEDKPNPSKTASTLGSGIIQKPSKVTLALDRDVNPLPSKVASTLDSSIMPKLLKPTQSKTAKATSAITGTSPVVTNNKLKGKEDTNTTPDPSVEDPYLASESIFITSDVATYDAPITGATDMTYASSSSHLNITDQYPSESINVPFEVQRLDSAPVKPKVKPVLGLNSKSANPSASSPTKPKSLNRKLSNPGPTLSIDSAIDSSNTLVDGEVNPSYPPLDSEVENNVKLAPDTMVSPVSTNRPRYEVNKANKPTTYSTIGQVPTGKENSKKPIARSNTAGKVSTLTKKTVLNSTSIKPVHKTQVLSTPEESPQATGDKTKTQFNKLNSAREAIEPSYSMATPTKVVKRPSLNMAKGVDKIKPSNIKQVADMVDTTKPEMPKADTKTKISNVKQVPEVNETIQPEMPKAIENENKPSNIMKVPGTVDNQSKSASNTMVAPKEVTETNPETLEVSKKQSEMNPNVWSSVDPGMTKSIIPVEKAEEQKKRLLNKMLKWTQLLQNQEHERQMEYTELMKELQQLQQVEHQIYSQRVYPY